MTAHDFAEGYKSAVYGAGEIAFTLSDQPTGVVLFEGRKFAIITAQNPQSVKLAEAENQKRNAGLEHDLKNLGLEYGPSNGSSPDGSWLEDGFVVFDLDLEEALELGRKYGQHAIVWGEGERVYLAWCASGKLEGFSVLEVLSDEDLALLRELEISISREDYLYRYALSKSPSKIGSGIFCYSNATVLKRNMGSWTVHSSSTSEAIEKGSLRQALKFAINTLENDTVECI